MILRYTPEAYSDLNEIKRYATEELENPSASDRIISHILECCANLKEHNYMGMSLAAKTGRDTDLRYIICGKHLAFYRIEFEYISVIRILDTRTNYMREIFGQ